MTNPRIAALAEALHEWEDGPASKASELNCYSCATWPDDNTPAFQPKPGDHCYESAAAILAALPPGWCGHSDFSMPVYRKEVARLRRIEEAARDASENAEMHFHQRPSTPMWWVDSRRMAALRAALEDR